MGDILKETMDAAKKLQEKKDYDAKVGEYVFRVLNNKLHNMKVGKWTSGLEDMMGTLAWEHPNWKEQEVALWATPYFENDKGIAVQLTVMDDRGFQKNIWDTIIPMKLTFDLKKDMATYKKAMGPIIRKAEQILKSKKLM